MISNIIPNIFNNKKKSIVHNAMFAISCTQLIFIACVIAMNESIGCEKCFITLEQTQSYLHKNFNSMNDMAFSCIKITLNMFTIPLELSV